MRSNASLSIFATSEFRDTAASTRRLRALPVSAARTERNHHQERGEHHPQRIVSIRDSSHGAP
jgi:hypothetical protein